MCVSAVKFNFKGIWFWASAGPLQDIHILVLKPFQFSFGWTLRVTVLLERKLFPQSNKLQITPEESLFIDLSFFFFFLQVNRPEKHHHTLGMMLPLPHFMLGKTCYVAPDICGLTWCLG